MEPDQSLISYGTRWLTGKNKKVVNNCDESSQTKEDRLFDQVATFARDYYARVK